MRLKRAEGATGGEIGHALGDTAVHYRLRREGDLARFRLGLQQITHLDADGLPDLARNDNLIFVLNRDQCHGSRTVELFTSTNSSLAVCQFDKVSFIKIRTALPPHFGALELRYPGYRYFARPAAR